MAETRISCKFDKEAVWKKVVGRKPIVLDMNCWINMGDDKFPLATRLKDVLRKLVADGLIICPLSFGLICELYKQGEDSRLRVGTLMEELSLSVSYAPKKEIFAWEVERAIRRLVDAGPFDLSLSEIYVPVSGYLASGFHLDFPEGFPPEHMDEFTRRVKDRAESLTLTELLKMRAAKKGDTIFDYVKRIPAPRFSEAAKRTCAVTKGDKAKVLHIALSSVYRLYIAPAIKKLPPPILLKFVEHAKVAPKERYGEPLKSMPALYNHAELMAARVQDPSRKDSINDFFDLEVMPVPLAYASAFVAQDRWIKHLLNYQTDILKRASCRYCFDLAELEEWLKTEVST